MCLIATLAAAQTIGHLEIALDDARFDSLFDLDRSNGLPDLASTLALAAAAGGAGVLAWREKGARRALAAPTAVFLMALALADLLHDGAHPWRRSGPFVIALVIATIALAVAIGARAAWRVRGTVALAVSCLAVSFLIIGLDRLDRRFERERGDPIAEYQIVAKEGLELIGWSLVALALWDEALTRRRSREDASSQDAVRPAAS